MALRSLSYEGGTAGATITAANSGLDIVVLQANATLVYSTAQAAHGTKSALITLSSAGASNTASMVYNLPASTTRAAARAYIRVAASPTVVQPSVLLIANTAGNSCRVGINLDRTLRVDNSAGTTVFTSSAVAINTWYRMELSAIRGTTTSNGTINFGLYLGDSTTPVTTGSFSSAAVNTGVNSLSNAQVGWTGTTAALNYALHVDDFAVQDGTATLLGPYANTAPTANAGAAQSNIEPYTTATLTGTDSDSDGTVASRAWTQTGGATVTLTGAATATATFTAPGTIAGSTLAFTYKVTDNGGTTGTGTTTVTVLPVTERAVIGGVEVPMRVRAN